LEIQGQIELLKHLQAPPGEALQILPPSFKKHKEKARSLSQPTTLSRELSSSTASGQKKSILRNRKQMGKEIFRILYAGKRSASRPFQEFWPLHLDSAIHLMENFRQISTHTNDFSWKKHDPNSPDFKEYFSKLPDFDGKYQEVVKNFTEFCFFFSLLSF
jgi:hypothetical protein